MRLLLSSLLGLAIAATPALAQSADRYDGPDAGQTLVTPTIEPNPGDTGAINPAFHIGNLPVGIWSPVEPPYDARADRNNAANPLWFDNNAP